MTSRTKVARAMGALALGFILTQTCDSVRAAERPGTVQGRVAQLGWLIGEWDCAVGDIDRPNAPRQVIRRRITSSPDGRVLLQVQHGAGLALRGMLGYDTSRKLWFEIDENENGELARELVLGPPNALQAHSWTLNGYLPAPKGRRFPLRAIYAWTDHGHFTFSAQLFRKDRKWETFQQQQCERASPAGTIPGAT